MNRRHRCFRLPARTLAVLLANCMLIFGCPQPGNPLAASAGVRQYQKDAFIALGFGQVNAIGGNLYVRRVELSIDTRLGTREIAAVYNSAREAWQWSFEASYDGATFRDESGADHVVGGVADGDAIPGTHWVKLDADTIRTKGGIVYQFDAEGRLATEHWADGSYPQLRYVASQIAGAPRTTRIDQCTSVSACVTFFDIGYDGVGRIEAITDRTGRQATFAWDASDRLLNAKDGLDVAEGRSGFQYEYAGAQLSAIVSSDGDRMEIDTASKRTTEIRLVGAPTAVHRFVYEKQVQGLFHTRHFPAGAGERRYAFDASRRLTELLRVDSDEATSFVWVGKRPILRTEPNGVTRSWIWSGDDPATAIEPSGNVVQYEYEPDGIDRARPYERPVSQISDSLGVVEVRVYDANGRPEAITNGAGETVTFGYASDGSVTSVISAVGVVREFSGHGDHGHATTLTVAGASIESVFDDVGNLVQGTNGAGSEWGAVHRRSFDADRNVRQIAFVDGATLEIDVRADGLRTRITRPDGDDHEMIHGDFGRLEERREFVDGLWQTTRFEYDAMGNRAAMERPNGMRRETVFDSDGRPILLRALRDGVEEGRLAFGWQDGLIVSTDDSMSGSAETLAYDLAGRLSSVTHGDGSFSTYGYDARSRRVDDLHVETDLTIVADLSRVYDGADREIGIQHAGDSLVERVYAQGRVSELRYGNGLVRAFDYDPTSGALLGSTSTDAGATVVESTTIDHFPTYFQLVTVATETHGGVEAMTGEAYYFSPGAESGEFGPRLIGEGTFGNYYHDVRANLLESPAGSRSYNAQRNRLLQVDGVGNYASDEAGFVTERGGVSLAWTAHGRLASHGADTFDWDMLGNLVSATVEGATATTRFSGSVQADAAGVPLFMNLGDVVIDLISGLHAYRHFDFRGNVKFTTDHAGSVRSHYDYDAYRVRGVHGADDDPVRFAGRAEIGDLMILGERIYDPSAGRFLSPDPIFQTINQFSYTLANPIWFSDPDGTQAGGSGTGAGLEAALGVLGDVATIYGFVGATALIFGSTTVAAAFGWIGAFIFALSVVVRRFGADVRLDDVASSSGSGGSSSGPGAGGFSSGGGGSVCSPTNATHVPVDAKNLRLLVPLQLLLGFLILRRRRPRNAA